MDENIAHSTPTTLKNSHPVDSPSAKFLFSPPLKKKSSPPPTKQQFSSYNPIKTAFLAVANKKSPSKISDSHPPLTAIWKTLNLVQSMVAPYHSHQLNNEIYMLHERCMHVTCKDNEDLFENLLKMITAYLFIMKVYRNWLLNFTRQRQVNFLQYRQSHCVGWSEK